MGKRRASIPRIQAWRGWGCRGNSEGGGPHLLPWDGNDQGRAGGRAFLWVAWLGREELGETRAKLETEWQGQVRAAGAGGQRSSCFGDSGESEQKD